MEKERNGVMESLGMHGIIGVILMIDRWVAYCVGEDKIVFLVLGNLPAVYM